MSTSRHKNRSVIRYAALTAFCFLFFLIYDRFSHNVRSFYMTFLWLWPFALGFLPSLAAKYTGMLHFPDIYHYGVVCITVSSLLRGIFEIAGTSSVYQMILFLTGFVMAGISLLISARIATSGKSVYYKCRNINSLRRKSLRNETEPDPENLRNRL